MTPLIDKDTIQPVLVSGDECIADTFQMWYYIDQNYHINSFRRNFDYCNQIAAKYDMYLKPNKLKYPQPFLKGT